MRLSGGRSVRRRETISTELGPIMARYDFLNGHLQSKIYQNTVRVKLNFGRRWQLVICGEKFMNFLLFPQRRGKCRFLPKIYNCILLGQDDILIE